MVVAPPRAAVALNTFIRQLLKRCNAPKREVARYHHEMNMLRLALAAMCLLAIAACGNKGPLVLPQKPLPVPLEDPLLPPEPLPADVPADTPAQTPVDVPATPEKDGDGTPR